MIFGIQLVSFLFASLIITGAVWIVLYIGFILKLKKEVDISLYFRTMFKGFKGSELRIGWSSLILGIEYILGLIIGGFIKSAWYPAQWTRQLVTFILFGQKRKDRMEREILKDIKRKKKDNDGVY